MSANKKQFTTTAAAMGLVASLLLWFGGCSRPEPPLRIGILEWPPYQFAALASQLGYLDASRIELVEFESPAEASRAYLSGGLDAVAMTLDYALNFHSLDETHQAFLAIDRSAGSDAAVSRTPIKDLREIAGKRIGLEGSALGSHMLRGLLNKAGVAQSEVQLSYFDIPDQPDAFRDGLVDVMITYEPNLSEFKKSGGQVLFSSREIPGEIIDIFFARETALEDRNADFRHFVTAWFQALDAYTKQREECAALMAPHVNLSAAEFETALTGVKLYTHADNRRMLITESQAFLREIDPFVRSVRAHNPKLVPPSLRRLFSSRALPESIPPRD